MIRPTAHVAIVTLLALLPAQVLAQDAGTPPTDDRLRAYSIAPPGQDGTVDPTLSSGPHFDDQRAVYASLIDDDDVTEAEMSRYFHSMQFGATNVERSYEPASGVTVYRDELGIPHIYADSMDGASFALGYVTAEDRLFEMDLFRHAARGTLAELVGPGTNGEFLEMDVDTRRNGYTDTEVQSMLDAFDDKFGSLGSEVQRGLQAYSDGVNAYIGEIKTTKADRVPAEYPATGNPPPVFPQEWSPLDTAYIAILQLRVFGETAGGELANAGLYAHLRQRLGKELGGEVFDDLLFQNDPRSPVTIDPGQANFKTQRLGKLDHASLAIPDDAQELAARETTSAQLREDVLAKFGFRAPSSNALLVGSSESASGNPLEFGAPQVGYAAPSFFMDVDVHAPGVDFRGPAVPGASALIPLGRGRDYAWSLTTGFSDAVDTRAELLCEPDGGAPTLESNGYELNGECRTMEEREETFLAKPTPVDPQPPQVRSETFHRTVHGPVIARGTVKGRPVAFVKERFFWMRELDSVPAFYRWNTQVDSIDDFAAAAEDFTMSFNAFYADATDIGYFHVGLYPKRTRHTSPALPVWGTGQWEWRGRRSWAEQPKIVNPQRGWVANWNNKPSLGWDSYDSFKWGRIQRMQLLHDGMSALLEGDRKARLSDLVDVIRDAATRDVRGVYLGPKMIRMIGPEVDTEEQAQALALVREWVSNGAHRFNRDGDDQMDDGAALAVFDAWYDLAVHRIFDDELGKRGFELIEAPVTDYTPEGGSSFFFDFSSYVANLFQRGTRSDMALNYCDDRGSPAKESCTSVALEAFELALRNLREQQGEDMSAWTTEAENIEFSALGAGTADPIPWQNRGTHNHAVEVLGDSGP